MADGASVELPVYRSVYSDELKEVLERPQGADFASTVLVRGLKGAGKKSLLKRYLLTRGRTAAPVPTYYLQLGKEPPEKLPWGAELDKLVGEIRGNVCGLTKGRASEKARERHTGALFPILSTLLELAESTPKHDGESHLVRLAQAFAVLGIGTVLASVTGKLDWGTPLAVGFMVVAGSVLAFERLPKLAKWWHRFRAGYVLGIDLGKYDHRKGNAVGSLSLKEHPNLFVQAFLSDLTGALPNEAPGSLANMRIIVDFDPDVSAQREQEMLAGAMALMRPGEIGNLPVGRWNRFISWFFRPDFSRISRTCQFVLVAEDREGLAEATAMATDEIHIQQPTSTEIREIVRQAASTWRLKDGQQTALSKAIAAISTDPRDVPEIPLVADIVKYCAGDGTQRSEFLPGATVEYLRLILNGAAKALHDYPLSYEPMESSWTARKLFIGQFEKQRTGLLRGQVDTDGVLATAEFFAAFDNAPLDHQVFNNIVGVDLDARAHAAHLFSTMAGHKVLHPAAKRILRMAGRRDSGDVFDYLNATVEAAAQFLSGTSRASDDALLTIALECMKELGAAKKIRKETERRFPELLAAAIAAAFDEDQAGRDQAKLRSRLAIAVLSFLARRPELDDTDAIVRFFAADSGISQHTRLAIVSAAVKVTEHLEANIIDREMHALLAGAHEVVNANFRRFDDPAIRELAASFQAQASETLDRLKLERFSSHPLLAEAARCYGLRWFLKLAEIDHVLQEMKTIDGGSLSDDAKVAAGALARRLGSYLFSERIKQWGGATIGLLDNVTRSTDAVMALVDSWLNDAGAKAELQVELLRYYVYAAEHLQKADTKQAEQRCQEYKNKAQRISIQLVKGLPRLGRNSLEMMYFEAATLGDKAAQFAALRDEISKYGIANLTYETAMRFWSANTDAKTTEDAKLEKITQICTIQRYKAMQSEAERNAVLANLFFGLGQTFGLRKEDDGFNTAMRLREEYARCLIEHLAFFRRNVLGMSASVRASKALEAAIADFARFEWLQRDGSLMQKIFAILRTQNLPPDRWVRGDFVFLTARADGTFEVESAGKRHPAEIDPNNLPKLVIFKRESGALQSVEGRILAGNHLNTVGASGMPLQTAFSDKLFAKVLHLLCPVTTSWAGVRASGARAVSLPKGHTYRFDREVPSTDFWIGGSRTWFVWKVPTAVKSAVLYNEGNLQRDIQEAFGTARLNLMEGRDHVRNLAKRREEEMRRFTRDCADELSLIPDGQGGVRFYAKRGRNLKARGSFAAMFSKIFGVEARLVESGGHAIAAQEDA